jgi:hypothetical protein
MLIIPTFEKDVLIVDETDEFNLPSIWYNTPDSTFDNYYNRLFPGADNWDYKSQGAPSRPFLSHYKVIMWHADNYPVASNAPHKIADPKNIEIFTDYLKVGGKFVMSGWGILKSFDITKGFPRSFGAGSFVFDYLHINQVNETGPIGDCTGGYAALPGFHDFKVDSAKLSFSLYSGMLGYVNLISATAGFTVALFSYENYPSSTYVSYRGRTMALRYYGTSYDAVVLGFPLFFIREADAAVMVQDILRSLKVQ